MGFCITLQVKLPLSWSELWTEWLARYHDSSLTAKELCRGEGDLQPNFHQCKKMFAEDRQAAPPIVLPISLDSLSPTSATMRLPGGGGIEIPDTIGQGELERIIAAVVSVTRCGMAS
ncbi:MAG: hypothetical protein ACF788_04305 [Novipirellula sp. JB048]